MPPAMSAHALLGGDVAAVVVAPQRAEAAAHAHGLHDLGVAAAGFGEGVALGDMAGAFLRARTRQPVGEQGKVTSTSEPTRR